MNQLAGSSLLVLRRHTLRTWIKRAAYSLGALGAYHRLRNRANLTTVMFHRVLPEASNEWLTADQGYTITTEIFASCLKFFRRHYNVIDIHQLALAVTGQRQLPDRPLLITFDDGWADTLHHAAPLLRAAGMPAVCFVAAGVLDDPEDRWWQDVFTCAWRRWSSTGQTGPASWSMPGDEKNTASNDPKHNDYLLTLAKIAALPKSERDDVIARCLEPGAKSMPRQMLRADQVRDLVDMGISVGAHGESHLPLTLSPHPREEFSESRLRLQATLENSPQNSVGSMSFPHGRLSGELAAMARSAGYSLLFTSNSALMDVSRTVLPGGLVGRIEIANQYVTDSAGKYRPDLLARHLFTQTATHAVLAQDH